MSLQLDIIGESLMSKTIWLMMSTGLFVLFVATAFLVPICIATQSHKQGWDSLLSFIVTIIPVLIFSGIFYEARAGLWALYVLTNNDARSEKVQKIQDDYKPSWSYWAPLIIAWAIGSWLVLHMF